MIKLQTAKKVGKVKKAEEQFHQKIEDPVCLIIKLFAIS